jgi:hypothetical protein
MKTYTTIRRRLRMVADLHRQRWHGFQSFAPVCAPGVVQTHHWATMPSMERLRSALQPLFDTAAKRLSRRYGIYGRNLYRSCHLHRLFARSLNDVPRAFIRPIAPIKRYLHVVWLHQWSLVADGADVTSPLLNRVWSFYPRYGIPCGLRRDGTLVLWIGAHGLRFARPRISPQVRCHPRA